LNHGTFENMQITRAAEYGVLGLTLAAQPARQEHQVAG
jgi:hypothetical protein